MVWVILPGGQGCKIAPGWETLLWFLGVVILNLTHLTLRRNMSLPLLSRWGRNCLSLQKITFPAKQLLNNFLPLYRLSLWEVKGRARVRVWHWFYGGAWHSWPWFSSVLSLSNSAKPKAKGNHIPLSVNLSSGFKQKLWLLLLPCCPWMWVRTSDFRFSFISYLWWTLLSPNVSSSIVIDF